MPASAHVWNFFRSGGLDQVVLQSGADLLALGDLDPKLWVALSCPTVGLELDGQTLAWIDLDGDGRIRIPEVIAAIRWSARRLRDVGVLLQGVDGVPLAAINDATPEGRAVLAAARAILASLGTKDAAVITAADSGRTEAIFAGVGLRGDGVIVAAAAGDAATGALIGDILACTGGSPGAAGGVGVTRAAMDAFYLETAAYAAWMDGGASAQVLGEATGAAWAAFSVVRAKVDDYFARCRLAAFDGRALAALNRSETDYVAIAARDMKSTSEELRDFPLARVAANQALPLIAGINPAWTQAMAAFVKAAVIPAFGAPKETLTEGEWAGLCARFSAFDAWMAVKAGASVDKLGIVRAREILAGRGRAGLLDLLDRDLALEPAFKAVGEVRRLAHYHRDLRALLHNFVNFADFYSRDRWAVFQAGTLYLDSRSTELCLRVDGANPLAAMSRACIAYCTLTRPGGRTMSIAACFTQGDSDFLFVGRHGVFIDRVGDDWDALVTSLVDNPIGLRQAFWAPYKKLVRLVEERVAKRAAEAEAAADAKLAGASEAVAAAKPAEPPRRIDVGTVAAIGVATAGGVSALTLILGYFLQLRLWQYPLVLLGLIVIISGPSIVLAWLKLRQRMLGPILEAMGWAVNGRVKINVPLGEALTDLAVKPPGSRVSLDDPYEDKGAAVRRRRAILLAVVLVLAAGAVWVRVDHNGRGCYFWEKRGGGSVPAAGAPPAGGASGATPAAASAAAPAPAK